MTIFLFLPVVLLVLLLGWSVASVANEIRQQIFCNHVGKQECQ